MAGKNGEAEDNPVKGISVTPTITALLKPTVEYLGIEIRDYFKTNIEEWKAKRREQNLNAHLQAVREKLAKVPPLHSARPSIRQLIIFDEWIEKAQDIDPEDSELSDIWQNLLAKAAGGEKVPVEVVAALKSLSPKEAQFLVEIQRTHLLPFLTRIASAENRYLTKSLEAKGILERDYNFLILLILTLSASGMLAYNVVSKMDTPFPFAKDIPMSTLSGIFIAVMVVSVGFSMWPRWIRWRKSWLGRKLLEFATPRPARHGGDDAQPGGQEGLADK